MSKILFIAAISAALFFSPLTVIAQNEEEISGASDELAVKNPFKDETRDKPSTKKIDDTPLATPHNLIAKWNGKFIDLSWNKVDGAEGYVLYRSITTTGADQFLMTARIRNAEKYCDSSVKKGGKYYYYIVAYKESPKKDCVKSERSDILTVKTN